MLIFYFLVSNHKENQVFPKQDYEGRPSDQNGYFGKTQNEDGEFSRYMDGGSRFRRCTGYFPADNEDW